MFVEDFVLALFRHTVRHPRSSIDLLGSKWHVDFIESVAPRVHAGQPLSTRQASTILTMAADRADALAASLGISGAAIATMVENPLYRNEPYQSTRVRREARHIGDNKLALRFKLDREIIAELKSIGANMGCERPVWVGWAAVWVVAITRQTLDRVVDLIALYGFHCDDATIDYLTMAHNSRGVETAFVLDAASNTIVANVCDNPVLSAWITNVLRIPPA